MGFPKIRGTLLGGPYNKDYSILGSILGSPCFEKLPYKGCAESSRWLGFQIYASELRNCRGMGEGSRKWTSLHWVLGL